MTDPVNVRIARFIGWTDVQSIGVRGGRPCRACLGGVVPRSECHTCGATGVVGGVEKWVGKAPRQHLAGCDRYCVNGCPMLTSTYEPIPDFEHDWSATGPLIQRFQIEIQFLFCGTRAHHYRGHPSRPPITEVMRPDEADILPAVARVLLAVAERNEQTERTKP